MKKLVYAGVGLVVLVVVAIGAAFAFVNAYDWNGYKTDIAEAARQATGRELAIDGDIEIGLSSSLVLSFSADGIRFANADGMAPAEMATIASVSGTIRLWPLLSEQVVVDSLVVAEPVINLGVDADGRANWRFPAKHAAATRAPKADDTGLPFADLRLADVRIQKGRFAYRDAASGQAVEASDIEVKVALESLTSPLAVDGAMILNAEPVSLELRVETLQGLLRGPQAQVSVALQTKHLTASYQGRVLRRPVDGLDGSFALDIASVGKLAAWLDRPFPKGQPDPGPLKVRAKFAGEGAKVALEEATIQGSALQVKASGSFDGSGKVAKIVLNLDSETLDIDRYLPPSVKGKAKAAKAKAARAPANPLAALSDEPLDLGGLKGAEADVKIRIAGIKAAGYRIGAVGFTAVLEGGVLTADLTRLALYGGRVTGTARLDASGEDLGLDVALAIAKVKVDELARAATGEVAVVGVASGTLEARTRGKSPRALAENLVGELAFSLGGIDVKKAPKGSISSLDLALLLPGLDKRPKLDGSIVYNKRKVTLAATTDPLRKVIQGDRFAAEVKLTSKLVKGGYSGMVQRRPVPGLDGKLDLDVASVGRLAKWLGQPLAKGQPDPGRLRIVAVMAAKGETVILKEARISGKALDAKASGRYDGSGKVAKLVLDIESGMLDIDRYLPPAKAARKPAKGAPADPLAALSDAPLDLAVLRRTEAEIKARIAGIKAVGYRLGAVAFDATLKGGVLRAKLSKLALYGGNVAGKATLDASAEALGIDTSLTFAKVKIDELTRAATGKAALVGVASGSIQARSKGRSARALARNVQGKLALSLSDGTVERIDLALDLPGPKKPLRLNGKLSYNKRKVAVEAVTDPLEALLAQNSFAAEISLQSELVTARYKGRVQRRPAPGLDGDFGLDIPSVAKLAGWLERPLAKGQPDPGPFKVVAKLATDGNAVLLKQARITGKALKANASGRFEAAKPVSKFKLEVDVLEANLNAYLPPEKKRRKGKAGAAGPAPWSKQPIDFSALRSADGQAVVSLAKVRYRNLVVDRGRLELRLKKGVMTATLADLRLAGGKVNAKVTVNAAAKAAKITYSAKVDGVQARPLLKAFADSDRLSGTMFMEASGKTRGRSEHGLVKAMKGKGAVQFLDGAIHGINIAAVLRRAQTLGFGQAASETQKTDFAELSGSYVIKKGVVRNRDLKMLAPLVRLSGSGAVPMPPQRVDYKLVAKLVGTLKGQGGKDALSGLPIPVRITGTWQKPKYTVDWGSVFEAIAKDPARIANMPNELKGVAEGMGIALPLPGSGTGGVPKPEDVLKGLLGSGQTSDSEQTTTTDPLKALKGLLGK